MQTASPSPAARPRRIPDAPPEPLRPAGGLPRALRAGLRIGLVLAWTLLACLVQAVLIRLPGRAKVEFARAYWCGMCRLLGLQVRVIGPPPPQGRPVVFVSNHSSWLDILALGGRLRACFVSKGDVARWPGVGTVARLGRTVFVSRARASTGRERDAMLARLRAGDNLLLFPEGTSSDGVRVLPFRSSFFSLAEGDDPPLVQPVSIAYDRLDGLPALRGARSVFAWYGGMDLAPHAWKLAGTRRLRATLLLHPPLDPRQFGSRKALARAAWDRVADGAAALRQNRAAPG